MNQTNAKKFIYDGILIYKSDTMHHSRSTVWGYVYKKSSDKFFKRRSHYKRFLVIDAEKPDTLFIQEDEHPRRNPKQIQVPDIICLQNVSANEYDAHSLPWPYSFEL